MQNDHHRELVVAGLAEAETQAQIHDRHDRAPQIDHAFDVFRRIRNLGHRVVTSNFLNFQNIYTVFLVTQPECQEFLGRLVALLL